MLPGEDRRRSPGLPSTGMDVCAGYGMAGTRARSRGRETPALKTRPPCGKEGDGRFPQLKPHS